MKNINITNADIVKSMSDEMKHNFANQCILNKIEPEDVIESIKNIVNPTINFAIDLLYESNIKSPKIILVY